MTDNTSTMFEVVPLDGKGMGLRATKPIPKGMRIMADKPLIIFEFNEEDNTMDDLMGVIGPKLAKLKDKHRASYRAYISLANVFTEDNKPEVHEAGIARTSSILLSARPDRHAVFELAARLNHSCYPNAFYSWNEAIGRLTVHAARDIKHGEEITIHYHIAVETLAARQQRHINAFRFVCKCTVCTAPVPARRRRDSLLCVLRRYIDIFDSGEIEVIKQNDSEYALRHSRELITVAKAAGMVNTIIADSYWEAAMTAIYNSDQARATVFAQRAHETRLLLEGPDSVTVKKLAKFAKSPASHNDYGISDAWKTKPQDVPSHLSKDDFECWLWRTSTGTAPLSEVAFRPILGDFKDTELYPLFDQLPHVNVLDPNYWVIDAEDNMISATKFWCLLGEIVHVDMGVGVKLVVKDKADTEFSVWFQTESLGFELGLGLLKNGNAIGINCAEYREMPGGQPNGIIQRRSGMTKIFDVSLEKLMQLSNAVQLYAIEDELGKKKCLGCDKVSEDLKAHCSRCNMMYYCDKDCQISAWKEKGHKTDCPLLATKEITGLLCCNWDAFE